jgi:hypothetical protein
MRKQGVSSQIPGDQALDNPRRRLRPRCAVPGSDGASSILSRQEEDALWEVFFTAAPAQRRVAPSLNRQIRRPAVSAQDLEVNPVHVEGVTHRVARHFPDLDAAQPINTRPADRATPRFASIPGEPCARLPAAALTPINVGAGFHLQSNRWTLRDSAPPPSSLGIFTA